MKISTKGRYGLMAMYRLRLNYGKGPISLMDIAKEEKLSVAYLEQLFSSLKKEKLVKSVRGANGGYELANPPNQIKIGDILNALEGGISVACTSMTNKPECRNVNTCPTRDILENLQYKIDEALNSLTLADMG